MLTKDDMHAIRHATDICVHLSTRNPQGLVRLIKRKPMFGAKPFDQDQEYVLAAPVAMNHWGHKELVENGTIECFAMVGIYRDQCDHVSSILKTLRAGDEIRFRFYPDALTNQYAETHGLHGDVLYLDVYRDGKVHARWELDHSIVPDNSARMCRGVPVKARQIA